MSVTNNSAPSYIHTGGVLLSYASAEPKMICADGTDVGDPDAVSPWPSCSSHGGIAQCPSNYQYLCKDADHCKNTIAGCDSWGGVRTTEFPYVGTEALEYVNTEPKMICADGTDVGDPDAVSPWPSCSSHGGIAQCPSNYQHLCKDADHCKNTTASCDSWGGIRGEVVTTVTYSATDSTGLSSTCDVTVRVEDEGLLSLSLFNSRSYGESL